MAENKSFSIADSIAAARARLAEEMLAQSEQIEKLNRELSELQSLHERTESELARQWDAVSEAATIAIAAMVPKITPGIVLDRVLVAVKALMDCATPEQVTQSLTVHAAEWGVRAAIFDVRGKSVWGSCAHGFGAGLTEGALRSVVVQLTKDNPFRQVCDKAAEVLTNAEALKKTRNVTEKLKPAPDAPIVLLPIRSAGTVTAILYADPAEQEGVLPVNALKILSEFAGAQIDRLIALSGGVVEAVAAGAVMPAESEPAIEDVAAEEGTAASEESHRQESAGMEAHSPESISVEAVVEAPAVTEVAKTVEVEAGQPPSIESEPAAGRGSEEPAHPIPAPPAKPEWRGRGTPDESTQEFPLPEMAVEVQPSSPAGEPAHDSAPVELHESGHEEVAAVDSPDGDSSGHHVAAPEPAFVDELPPEAAAPAAPAPDLAQMDEAEQKAHKDAKRFAKLLVSEIELYNKTKVADGRQNRDLYKRLKSDIDRSRLTFEKRFGKGPIQQVDYFHDELVKILAQNDTALLGPEYPGPSM